MLTAQKRKYALALMSGMSQKDAAIKAGYSEKSARSKGSQLAKDPEVNAFIERKKREKVEVDDEPQHRRNVYTPAVNTAAEKPPPVAPSASQSEAAQYEDPLDFLKSVMNNVGYEIETRKDAAKAMLPYVHQKKGEGGKKDAKAEAAKKAANKFAIQQPPKLVVNNRGNT